MSIKIGYIYKIKNLINEKEYIGCTINPINKRFEEHVYRCLKTDSNTKFCNSIRKYGVENFNIELIEECNVSNIYEKEKFYITEFKTYKNGLNSTVGGEGCLGYVHSPEIRKKISENTKNGNSHRGKTYEELYGDSAEEQKEKRRLSVKEGWGALTTEDKEKRVLKMKNSLQQNSKYDIGLIQEIKSKINEGLKIKEFRELYPQIREGLYYELKNNRRWVNI